jgi:hypothetical protein
VPAPQTIAEGGKVQEPLDAITKTGNGLFGWYKEAAGTTRWRFAADTVNANVTLYAKWGTPISSTGDIETYINSQTGAGDDADNPIRLPLSFDLGIMTAPGSGWQQLLAVIDMAGKHVVLDLGACTMTGTEFNPDSSVNTGKANIVGIILPDVAETIADGYSSEPTFKEFTGLRFVAGANITDVGKSAFRNLSSLASVSLPAATTIDQSAFRDCSGLASVSLPAAASIGSSAFAACTRLSSVSLPVVASIARYAVADCTSLTSVSFPASATVGNNPFAACTALTSITLTGSGALSVIASGKALVRNRNELVSYPTATGSITVNDITTIGSDAFAYCTGLSSVSLPAAVSIGDYAFSDCTSLASVSLPTVNSIGGIAFGRTGTGALSITMKSAAPTLGQDIFDGINSPKTVTVKVPYGATGYDEAWKNSFKDSSSIVVNVVEQ